MEISYREVLQCYCPSRAVAAVTRPTIVKFGVKRGACGDLNNQLSS